MKKILILLTATALTLTAQTFNVSTTPELRTALVDAAQNGQDDTIILADGIYMTTDDGEGTFEYLDNEMYDLTLIGSSRDNVILSGAEIQRIFRYRSLRGTNFKVEKLSFIDGGIRDPDNRIHGGGIRVESANITVVDCNFTNNYGFYGGGIHSYGNNGLNINISNTVFSANSASFGGGFKSDATSDSTVIIDNSKFINNSTIRSESCTLACDFGSGAGFHISSKAIVINSIFSNNTAQARGAGFHSRGAEISDSNFTENIVASALQPSISTGGGFYSIKDGATVKNTIFHKNSAWNGGGFFSNNDAYSGWADTIVTKCEFTENKALNTEPAIDGHSGGAGFYVAANGNTQVIDSVFKLNESSSHGGGFITPNTLLTVVNTIFDANTANAQGGAFFSGNIFMSNSIITNNSSGVNIRTVGYVGGVEDPNILKNNVFNNNVNSNNVYSNINGDELSSNLIHYNYINTNYVDGPQLLSNNIFENVNLGFVDLTNGDYHLTATSDLIDAGTNDHADKFIVDGVNYLANDYADNNRSVGANMDIGVYEYTTSKPTIASFTHSEDPKTLNEITFDVEYVLSDEREILEVSFDYLNDGTFSTDETHIYPEAKTYQVTVKVTDDSGEFSLRTIAVIVSALPFSDMTDEQKLIDATNPARYDDIVSIIEQEKVDAEDVGRAYVQDNLPEFGLLTEADRDTAVTVAVTAAVTTATLEGVTTGKEYVQDNLEEFNLIDKSTAEFTAASLATLPLGWSLVGVSLDMTDLSVFDDAGIVWTYDNSASSWGAYSSDAEMKRKITEMPGVNLLTTIPAGSGVWIEK